MTNLVERSDICPGCGDEFVNIARHWAARPDHRPDLDYVQTSVVSGLLTAGGSASLNDRSANVELRTQYLGFAVWLFEHLDWLGGGIYVIDADEDDRKTRMSYCVRSKAHPGLRTYAKRRESDDLPSSQEAIPNALALRTFVARAGSVSWVGENRTGRQTTFYAEDESNRGLYEDIFDNFGIDTTTSGFEVALSQRQSERLFDMIGPPVPGVEHKWEFDNDEYTDVRNEQYATQINVEERPKRDGVLGKMPAAWQFKYSEREVVLALRTAAADLGHSPSIDEYHQWRNEQPTTLPSAHWMSSHRGWNAWKRIADLDTTRPKHEEYTTAERDAALRAAASDLGEPLNSLEYEQWARKKENAPSLQTLVRRWGWEQACREVGVEPKGSPGVLYGAESAVEAVRRIREEIGHWPNISEYDRHSDASDPSTSTIWEADRFPDTWEEVIEAARSE